IIGDEEADIPRALLAGEAHAESWIGDSAGKQQLREAVYTYVSVAEKICVFQEEGPFFREEDFEALVDGVLRFVGLDLSEVGIDGGVEDEAVMKDEFGIQACLALRIDLVETRLRWIASIERAEASE